MRLPVFIRVACCMASAGLGVTAAFAQGLEGPAHAGECAGLAAPAEAAMTAAADGEFTDSSLIVALAYCLGDPDPAIRDGLAYGRLAALLRAGAVGVGDRRALLEDLSAALAPDAPEGEGFLKPFAALVLSEVARTDRVDPWMSDAEREALVGTGAAYLERVSDYRGFDDEEGWRHGVAHGADLLMQLSLNPAIGEVAAMHMVNAIARQIASDEAPAFIFDEPRRLSRPLLYLTQRGLLTEAELTAWFAGLARPGPLASWDEAFSSESALARRHNLRAFAYAVLVAATENEDENLKRLRPGALHLLAAIP